MGAIPGIGDAAQVARRTLNAVTDAARVGLRVGVRGAGRLKCVVATRLHITHLVGACFAAGTQVAVGYDEAGEPVTRNIEDIAVGDWVLSRSDADAGDEVELRRVTGVQRYVKDHTRHVTLLTAEGEAQSLATTDEHPFYVLTPEANTPEAGAPEAGQWVAAGYLREGDRVLQLDGGYAVVQGTWREEHAEGAGVTVYNLTVKGGHTYFVDDQSPGGAVWVHNACAGYNHLVSRALASKMPYRHRVLQYMTKAEHTAYHDAMSKFMRNYKMPNGTVYDLAARRGRSGKTIRSTVPPEVRLRALTDFNRTYEGGKYFKSFQAELRECVIEGWLR
jgi:hypothetical protein